jgi:hypothetical protein
MHFKWAEESLGKFSQHNTLNIKTALTCFHYTPVDQLFHDTKPNIENDGKLELLAYLALLTY